MTDLDLMGKAAVIVCAYRIAYERPSDHIFFCEDNPHGFREAVTVHVMPDGRVQVCELPDVS